MMYSDAYEAELRKLLEQYAADNANAGAEERAAFAERLASDRGWANEGPFAYAVAHYADDVIAAEQRSRVAAMITTGLAHVDEPKEGGHIAQPSDVLAHVKQQLGRDTHEALQGGRSTNPWHNLVVAELGRTAHKQLDDGSWGGLGSLAHRAVWAARDAIAKDQLAAMYSAKADVDRAKASLERARTDGGRAVRAKELEVCEGALAAYTAEVQAALVAAGAPQEVLAA